MSNQPHCMIAEDQALIGLALEAYLEEAGFKISGLFPTNAKALGWLEQDTPDLALLDVMLGDGPCLLLARELKRRSVPFAVYSALPATGDHPPELLGVPWLEKPAKREVVAQTLENLVNASS
ncbi:response regulator [Microvirga lenta]|uniref:response regulator n=1 Tax=Microvirga lenta TaxID=2881337 RepID=UPI001CFFAAFA|nr:response regulator [Microvirga lenta]MCB5175737.1 response regulator [Microvirga lenta]